MDDKIKWEYNPEENDWELHTFHEPAQEMTITGLVYRHPEGNEISFQTGDWVAFTADEILAIHTKMKELEGYYVQEQT